MKHPKPDELTQTSVAHIADPIFSVHRGFFKNPFNLTISCSTPGSAIIYTLDGSQPSTDLGLKSEIDKPVTILLRKTTVLRAFAVRSDHHSSDVKTYTDIFTDQISKKRTLKIYQKGFNLE